MFHRIAEEFKQSLTANFVVCKRSWASFARSFWTSKSSYRMLSYSLLFDVIIVLLHDRDVLIGGCSSWIIVRQPPRVMKTHVRFVLSSCLLIGGKLNITSSRPMVSFAARS